TPIIATMIASTSYYKIIHSLPPKRQKLITAVFADPDPEKQAHLGKLILGHQARLVTAVTHDSAAIMARPGTDEVTTYNVDGERLGQWLGNLRGAALIAIPDSAIYNKDSIRTIITALYHRNIPIIGYNEAFVRAGALASVDSQPTDLIPQIVDAISLYKDERKLIAPAYPKRFRVIINEQLARSLGVQVPNVERIQSLLAGGKQ